MPPMEIKTLTIAINDDTTDPIKAASHTVFTVRNETASALDGALGIQTWAGEGEPDDNAVWTWLRDANGAGGLAANTILGIDTVSATSEYTLPAEVCAAQWMRLVSHDGSGGEQLQSAARTIKLVKKALNS